MGLHSTRHNTPSMAILLLSIIFVGLNLRPSMAAIGPLLSAIRQDIPFSFAMASMLTMMPVLAMGISLFFGMRLAKWIGEHQAITLSLLIIGLATFARLFVNSSFSLILSAVISGFGIAIIQAILPAVIKAKFKSNVSLYMGFYVTSIMAGAAVAASLSPFVMTQLNSWRSGLAIWCVLTIIALALWMSQRKNLSVAIEDESQCDICENHFTTKRSWLLAVFFGFGTASYTCVLAWLAPYYVELGWTEQSAGLVLGLMTTMEVVAGFVVPALANKHKDRRGFLVVLLILIIIGFCGLILAPHHLSLLWPCFLGLGIGGVFALSLIVSIDHIDNPRRAGSLTAFVQGIGYLIAGLSPFIAGIIRDKFNSFEGAWWMLVVLMAVMIVMALRFDPNRYQHHYPHSAPLIEK